MKTLKDRRTRLRTVSVRGPATLFELRRQLKVATILLFFPWLLTLLLSLNLSGDRPLIALMPGLLVAGYIRCCLASHLATNHRPGEKEQLFSTLGGANWITLARAAAIVALAGFLPFSLQGPELGNTILSGWLPGALYLAISLADLCDGYVARRQGRETALGRRLDIEADAAGLLTASLLAIVLGQLPVAYIMVGLAYYPFILGSRLRQRSGLPVVTLHPRPYSRIIAGCQMGLVGLVLLPIFTPPFTFMAAYLFMTPLLLGFLRDWLVVSCRIATDGNQQTVLDQRVRDLMVKLVIAVRLVILVSGLFWFGSGAAARLTPGWQLLLGLCLLLASIGFLGRCCCLFLVLLLGSNLSPLELSFYSGALFILATILLLSGTGPLSLWSPEEEVLYRRRNKVGSGDGCP